MKWLFSLLLFIPNFSNAQKLKDWAPQFQAKFCGLDTLHDSSLLDDCDAQAAQNVLTDRGFLEERPGNQRLTTVLAGSPIKQLYEYVSPANTRFLIAHVSTAVYQTNLSGAPVVLSTIAANQNLECTMLYGVLICDDGSGAAWSFNGTSTAPVNGGMPICNLLASEYGRVFCGAPSTDLSQVAVSSYPSYNVWTPSTLVPLPANSATSFEFSPNDGDSIQCMRTTPWGLFVGKRNSSYILKGFDNNSFFIQTIDPIIGCVDQRTVQIVNGILTWMSQKGVYQWPGNGPPVWISEKIDPTFRGIRQLSSNSNFWELQTQADWQTGTFTTNGPKNTWDATSVVGYILPSSSPFLSSNIPFSSGTVFTNIDTTTVPGSIQISSAPTNAQTVNSTITFGNGTNDFINTNPNTVSYTFSIPGGNPNGFAIGYQYVSTVTVTYGVWSSTFDVSAFSISGRSEATYMRWWFIADNSSTGTVNGYSLIVDGSLGLGNGVYVISLEKWTTGSSVVLSSFSYTGNSELICSFNINRSPVTGFSITATNTATTLAGDSCQSIALGSNDMSFSTSSVAIAQAAITLHQGNGSAISATLFLNNQTFPTSFYASSATFVSPIFDTQFSTPTWGVLNATFTVATNNLEGQTSFFTRVSTSPNNDKWDAYVASSDTVKIGSAAKRYTQYEVIMVPLISTKTPNVSAIGYTAVSTGIYYSPVDFVGTKITTWKQFNVQDYQQTPGEFQYYVRSASYTFTPLQTTPAWVAQPNNQTVVVATGSFFEWKVDSSSITSSSQAVILANASISRSIVNWQEGTSIKPASGFMDQRYFLCVMLSTSDVINDGCLVFQRNRNWTLFNGPSISAMSQFNFQLIGGDGSSNSKVWYLMQPNYDDDGSVISSSWTSKDFIIGSPFNQKTFYEIWLDNKYSLGSTLTVGWAMDKNTVFTQKTIPLDNTSTFSSVAGNFASINRVYPNKGYELGKYVKFSFSQNLLDLPWSLNDYLFYVDVQLKQSQ